MLQAFEFPRWPSLATVGGLLVVAGSVFPQEGENPPAVTCQDLVLYKVCGDATNFSSIAARFPGLFDLAEKETAEFRSTVSSMVQGVSSAGGDPVRRAPRLESIWNAHIERIIPKLRLVGSYLTFDERNGEITAQGPLNFSLSADFRLGTHYLINQSGLREFRRAVPAQSNLRIPERMLLNERPAFTIHLNWGQETILYDEDAIVAMCRAIARSPYAQANLAGSAAENFLRQCGDALQSEFQIIFGMGHVVGDLAIEYYRLFWATSLWLDEFKQHLLSHPRRVYVIDSAVGISPRVDSVGNLYIPQYLYENLVPHEDYLTRRARSPAEAEDVFSDLHLEMIMLHEAAHIELMPYDLTRLIAAIWSNNAIDRLYNEGMLETEISLAEHQQMLVPFFRFMRASDEAFVDLLVLGWLGDEESVHEEYQSLVERLEISLPQRSVVIRAGSRYILSNRTSGRLLALLPLIMFEQFEITARDFRLASATETKLAKDYVQAYFEFLQERWVQASARIISPVDRRISPWDFKDEMESFFDSLDRPVD